MAPRTVSDAWDDVWADYDARQLRLATARAVPRRPSRPQLTLPNPQVHTARPVRFWLHALAAILAGGFAVGLWLALPWLVAARLSVAIGAADAPGLMRQLNAPATLASFRAGLDAEVPVGVGEGARRFLSGMAERMAASWQTPTGMRAWLALRARGGPGDGSPVPLTTLRAARPIGLTAFRLEYGPARGEGGVAFDVAWQEGDFRVVGVRFLGPAPRPWSAAVMAMR